MCVYVWVFLYVYRDIYMGVPEYHSKIVRILATTRPSRKCELMKLYVPFVSSMYASMLRLLLLLRSTGTVFENYGPYHLLLLSNVDYIHSCYHYNVLYIMYYI